MLHVAFQRLCFILYASFISPSIGYYALFQSAQGANNAQLGPLSTIVVVIGLLAPSARLKLLVDQSARCLPSRNAVTQPLTGRFAILHGRAARDTAGRVPRNASTAYRLKSRPLAPHHHTYGVPTILTSTTEANVVRLLVIRTCVPRMSCPSC